MNAVVNPYIPSGNIPLENIIVSPNKANRLFSPLTVGGGALGIYGERGTGKSCLLRYISNPPEDWKNTHLKNHIFVPFNCDQVDAARLSSFWTQAVRQLDSSLEPGVIKDRTAAVLAGLGAGADAGPGDFYKILDAAGQTGKRIALVLDDFDYLICTENGQLDATRVFLHNLRSLTTRQSNPANLVVATRRSLEDLNRPMSVPGASPFSNGFVLNRLGLLGPAEMTQLLLRIQEAGMEAFTPQESSYICYLSGNHPQLAVIAAAEVFDQRLDQGGPLTKLKSVGENFRKGQASDVFDSLWEAANEVEKMLLMAIAMQKLKGKLPERQYDLSDLPVIFNQREREMLDMSGRGLLFRKQAGGTGWTIFSPIFEWWILKEIETLEPAKLEDYRKVWGNLLTRKQADKIGQLVNVVRDNLGLIEELGKTVLKIAGVRLPFGG
jgi:hypothetical protein